MSELSRLRARWIRLEQRIAKLEKEADEALDVEGAEILEKVQVARLSLAATIAETGVEERRLMDVNAKLVFKPKQRKPKKSRKVAA